MQVPLTVLGAVHGDRADVLAAFEEGDTVQDVAAALADELRARGVAFEAIGDCVAPRRAGLAIYEGRELALRS